ncbi:MAG: aminotransferase class IV [Bradymonadia bacterium]
MPIPTRDPVLVSINGQITGPEEATISVFDRGFLHGDSVYEVMRTHHGRPLFWYAHRERLVASAQRMGMILGSLVNTIYTNMHGLLEGVTWGESYVRIVITRGEGPLSLDPKTAYPPNRVIFAKPMPRVPQKLLEIGCILTSFQTHRRDLGEEGNRDPKVKSGDRTLAVKGARMARDTGAYESLRVDTLGRVLEGGTSTFFGVKDGQLITPDLSVGILDGITRRKVIEAARTVGVEVITPTIYRHDLEALDEVFITSSVRGIVPVRNIDGLIYEAPGPITQQLVAGYGDLMDRDVGV